jgi:hypothetical protein
MLHEAYNLFPLRELKVFLKVIVIIKAFNAQTKWFDLDVPEPTSSLQASLKIGAFMCEQPLCSKVVLRCVFKKLVMTVELSLEHKNLVILGGPHYIHPLDLNCLRWLVHRTLLY